MASSYFSTTAKQQSHILCFCKDTTYLYLNYYYMERGFEELQATAVLGVTSLTHTHSSKQPDNPNSRLPPSQTLSQGKGSNQIRLVQTAIFLRNFLQARVSPEKPVVWFNFGSHQLQGNASRPAGHLKKKGRMLTQNFSPRRQ